MKKQKLILGVIIAMGLSLLAAYPRVFRMDPIEWDVIFAAVLFSFFFGLFCWFAHWYLLQNRKITRLIPYRPLRTLFVVCLVAAFMFLYDHVLTLLGDTWGHVLEIKANKRVPILLLRGLVMSGLFYFIVYYLYLVEEKQNHLLEIEKLKQAQLQANLSSLKEQLSPHFLFNTLNTLSTLTREPAVKDFVAELAEVYRYVLQYKEANTATLAQELDFIESYLYIVKTRLEDAIEISIQVDSTLLQTPIPPLTLQLLIENAIKHNITSAAKQLHIRIYNEGRQAIVVQNNVQPKASFQSTTGIGLANVWQRYQLLFNKDIVIEKGDTTFTVKLPVV